MELNHHSSRGAFTAPWARHCPAYPCQESGVSKQWSAGRRCRPFLIIDPLELEEGEGVEPSTQRSARLSRPVAHHRAPPSDIDRGVSDQLMSDQTPLITDHDPGHGQGGWIRTNGLLLPRQELWPG